MKNQKSFCALFRANTGKTVYQPKPGNPPAQWQRPRVDMIRTWKL